MMQFRVERGSILNAKGDVVACFVSEDRDFHKRQVNSLRKIFPSLAPALNSGTFTGKFQETLVLFPAEKKFTLVLIGLGLEEKYSIERLRKAAATAAKAASTLKGGSVTFIEPELSAGSIVEFADAESVGTALAEGAGLSLYKFNKYLSKKNQSGRTIKRISIVTEDTHREKELKKGVTRAQVVVDATHFARDLANAPANEIYPETLALKAKQAGKKSGFSVTIFDEKKIRKVGMGGVAAVAQGSERPPRFIIMEHRGSPRGRRPKSTVVLVGKGVTFDAGGISIKPAAGMAEMKMDMSGAAAVLATMQAVSRLKLPLHVIGLIPAVENLLNGAAMKPGDIILHLNGKTSEVDNTDAEGRLILADALSYASRYKPDLVIDLATLTGHVVLSLGHYATGMMGNNQEVMDLLKEAGERTYERVWQLPMFDEYEKLNKSDVADVKNSGGRPAGTITAAFFLKQFIGDYKWVHLDIAGTAIAGESFDYIPKGGSGVGVRLLVDFLRNRSMKKP